jgi:N-acetylmuramoyl-L-alanine amidase
MPGVLVEPLFLTAPREAALASSQSGQRRIAQALVAGLEAYLAK